MGTELESLDTELAANTATIDSVGPNAQQIVDATTAAAEMEELRAQREAYAASLGEGVTQDEADATGFDLAAGTGVDAADAFAALNGANAVGTQSPPPSPEEIQAELQAIHLMSEEERAGALRDLARRAGTTLLTQGMYCSTETMTVTDPDSGEVTEHVLANPFLQNRLEQLNQITPAEDRDAAYARFAAQIYGLEHDPNGELSEDLEARVSALKSMNESQRLADQLIGEVHNYRAMPDDMREARIKHWRPNTACLQNKSSHCTKTRCLAPMNNWKPRLQIRCAWKT